jgi:glycosyltransferase involved in cell wall biosynthesis
VLEPLPEPRVDNPSFSIVIPTYQRRETVCRTLNALNATDYPGSLEIIVVIDGSSDGTRAALEQIDCPFELRIAEQANRGLGAARNRGAREARNEIILFVDDDMIAEPDLVEQHARMYRVGADGCTGRFVPARGPGAGFLSGGKPQSPTRDPAAPHLITAFDICGGQISVRRSVFEELGGFEESFTANGKYGFEDFEFGHRLLQRFDVRENPSAVTHHSGVVSPREFLRRARCCARAQTEFVAMHPEVKVQFDRQKAGFLGSRTLKRFVALPVIPRIAAGSVALFATIAMRTRLRSSRRLEQACHLAFAVTYWSEIRRSGGLDDV